MNKQEAIEKINDLWSFALEDGPFEVDLITKSLVIDIISQIDETQKPVVPQFVAEWIEGMKQDERPLYSAMSSLMNKTNHEWGVWKSANMNFSEIVAQAWIYGYTVEKEKLYTVEIPNPNSAGGKLVLFKQQSSGRLILDILNPNINKPKYLHLTESEIKQDFEWAWQWAEPVEDK